MNTLFDSIKLDYYILKSSDMRRILILVIVPILGGVMGKNPLLIIGFMMFLFAFVMSMIFATAEKGNLNKLYGILPLEKRQTVIGRYLFALCAGVVVVALASALAFAAAYVMNIKLVGFTFAAWLCGSFLLFSFVVAAQFPLYFKYDFSKLSAFANLPYVILILIGSFLIRKHPEFFSQAIKLFIQNPYMVWVLAIAGSVLLLGVSMFIAIGLYKNREL